MKLSIVIPVFNEVENLPLLHASIERSLSGTGLDWEAVYVDDGSSDGSLSILEGLAATYPTHVCVVAFRRNFGQTAAIEACLTDLNLLVKVAEHAFGKPTQQIQADIREDWMLPAGDDVAD